MEQIVAAVAVVARAPALQAARTMMALHPLAGPVAAEEPASEQLAALEQEQAALLELAVAAEREGSDLPDLQ